MIHPHMLNQFLCVYDNVLSDGLSLCHLCKNIQQNIDVW